MSDRDLIVQFLERAEKRARSNKRFNEIATTLAVAGIIPVSFKLLDFYFLFRARTVSAFFGIWLVATLAYVIWKIRGRNPLAQVAASVDRKASLNDQLKTAYWFIRNPRDSEWVEAQIQRAAKATSQVRLDSVFPRRFPRASWIAAGLLFVLIALNFIPLPFNHNWVLLQAAPPFSLSEAERINLEKAIKLLEKAKATENSQLADKIQELINNLEQGDLSLDDAIKQLDALKDELEAGDLDNANMTNGLEQMAAILRQSQQLKTAGQKMGRGQLNEAAAEMRLVGEHLGSVSAADVQEMAQKMHAASDSPRSGLQDLANALDTASSALQRGDKTASQSALDRIARELESLREKMDDQALRSEAGDKLSDLVDSLEQRDNEAQGTGTETGGKAAGQGKSDQKGGGGEGKGEGQKGEKGEAQQQGGGDPQDSQGGEGEPSDESSKQAGQNPGANSPNAPNGQGGNSFGGSTKSAPLEGDATTLEVQLQKQALQIEGQGGSKEPEKDAEAAGERERSRLDYRNAPSDLTPAQKDLLNQDRIPWENKQLIKTYFQAVKPKSK
jgi:hypothetical protein